MNFDEKFRQFCGDFEYKYIIRYKPMLKVFKKSRNVSAFKVETTLNNFITAKNNLNI